MDIIYAGNTFVETHDYEISVPQGVNYDCLFQVRRVG
jgi:hypothetical protein